MQGADFMGTARKSLHHAAVRLPEPDPFRMSTVNPDPPAAEREAKPARPARLLDFGKTRFVAAAHRLEQLPADRGAEVACAGRSNAGKSSALNAICGISGLARVSKTPGRTQQLVLFAIDDERRLVDLPGYGYAAVSKELRAHWGEELARFFRQRQCLRGLLIAMDSRHPMSPFDDLMLELIGAVGRPAHVLLTKADKLSKSQALATLRAVTTELKSRSPDFTAQLFSAPKKDGVDQARRVLSTWLS